MEEQMNMCDCVGFVLQSASLLSTLSTNIYICTYSLSTPGAF